MNKKGVIGIIVGVLVVILIVGIGAYFVLKKDNSGNDNSAVVNNSVGNLGSGDWCSKTGGAMKMKLAQYGGGASVTKVGYENYKNKKRCNIEFGLPNGMIEDWYVDVDAGFNSGRPRDYWKVTNYGTGIIESHYIDDKCVDLTCSGISEKDCETLKSIQCLGTFSIPD